MHGADRQCLEGFEIDQGEVGTVAKAVDCATHLVRCARLLFTQCHSSVNGSQGEFLEWLEWCSRTVRKAVPGDRRLRPWRRWSGNEAWWRSRWSIEASTTQEPESAGSSTSPGVSRRRWCWWDRAWGACVG